MKTQKACSPVAQAIIDAAESGNTFAQYLLESKDYYAEKVKKNRKEQLEKTLHYAKHSKCKRRIQKMLRELKEVE